MNLKYLVRWSPYKVLRVLVDDEICEVPVGCDIVNNLLEDMEQPVLEWRGQIDWDLVLSLYDKKDYLKIFLLHTENKWSNEVYCCTYFEKYVDYNVELYKNTKRQKG